jgi:hypothetical protein
MQERHSGMAAKRAPEKAKSPRVFGHARKPAKMFRAGLYARVSTNDQQTIPLQTRALREYAVRRGWTIALQVKEVGSGASERQLREKLLEAARRREIDVVLVWRLDRWGRSVADLLATLQELQHLGVGFVSLTEALDLTTPAGRAMAGLLAVFAEFVLAAAGEGATLADQWEPHRQCSVAVSGDRVEWCPEQALRRSGLDFQGIGVYRSDVGFGRGARCAGPRHDERPAWPQVMPRQ